MKKLIQTIKTELSSTRFWEKIGITIFVIIMLSIVAAVGIACYKVVF